ncbi:glutamine--tRNA ligase [Buchnera aphidicola (Mollitrichosiphum nigrofasciatum)]|uniref:glutamine--tRNA ligase n=1 Tax=Buchnera aphidicola TaxID=9 RepID=UPI0031B8AA96
MNKETFNKNNFIYKIIEKYIKNKKTRTIRTRFPPEPNGYLHLGHIKSICINFEIAKIKKGKCNLRFDDTNPNTEKKEFIHSIKSDIRWLDYKWDNIFYTSCYFKKIYKYAIKLIKKNLAYVDLSSIKKIKKERGNFYKLGTENIFREQSIQKNLILFQKMKNGIFKEGEACLRAKINMHSPLVIMRDPIIYRIKFFTHHTTKKKWCIYPTYDFSHCISDSIEKITHSFCTLEFLDNKKLYKWFLKKIKTKNNPIQYEFSKLNLEYTVLSKRKLKQIIKKKIVNGWNDPRIPTIAGLRRRGYTALALRNFCIKSGITKQTHYLQLPLLESCIRQELNITAHRTMIIINPIKLIITNLPKQYKELMIINNHPNNIKMGKKCLLFTNTIYIEKNDIYKFLKNKNIEKFKKILIKLKYAYYITIYKIKIIKNKPIIFCKYHKNTLGKINKTNKKNKIIHWISIKDAKKAEFRLYEPLFTIKKPEISENFLNYINKKSMIIKNGFVESEMYTKKIFFHYQFERKGYFYVDPVYSRPKKLVFNQIVGLKKKINNLNKKIIL